MEFVRVFNGGGQLDLYQGVGMLLFSSPSSAWEFDVGGGLYGGRTEGTYDSLDVSGHAIHVALGRRRYHRVADRVAAFQALAVSFGVSRSDNEQSGTTMEYSGNSVGLRGGLGATVWATRWLAFAFRYDASAYYSWTRTEIDNLGTNTKTESSYWTADLDGITLSGALFF